MLGQVQRTEYDLRFPLFGIQVNVHPLFWLVSVIMGWSALEQGPEYVAIWVICVFVSILIHELGHAVVAKIFGYQPEIYLYTFGGLATFTPDSRFTTWKSIAVSFAGPAAGFLLFGIVFSAHLIIVYRHIVPHPYVADAIGNLEWINLAWGLVNLLPVLPLDGGRICESLLDRFMRYKSREWAAMIGIVVAGLVALFFFTVQMQYAGFLFAYLSYINFNNYQMAKRGYW